MVKNRCMKKIKRKIIRFYAIIFGIIILVFVVLNLVDLDTETLEEYYSTHYDLGWTNFNVYGIVEDKFIDKKAHNNPTIIIRDISNKRLNFAFQTNDLDFYNYVHIGDSVMSSRRSCKAKVWNKFSSREFDFINE